MSPSVLNLFSSSFEMEEVIQSRLVAAPALRDAEGALALAVLAVAPELAVIVFLPIAARELLDAEEMVRQMQGKR
jgi:hypothetical protein